MLKLVGENSNVDKQSLIMEFHDNMKNKLNGVLYAGYPIYTDNITTRTLEIDSFLISDKGILAIHIPDKQLIDYTKIQDDIYNRVEVKLKSYSFLVEKRKLIHDFDVISIGKEDLFSSNVVGGVEGLKRFVIENLKDEISEDDQRKINSAIQDAYGLSKRKEITSVKGTKSENIAKMNDIIEEYDENQMEAILKDPIGIQRIRGMAGSGKTIILAKKVAELHTKYPEWKILITYNTRSIKYMLEDLIGRFYRHTNNGREPDYENLKIMQAWGGAGGNGFYYDLCRTYGIQPLSFHEAKAKYNYNTAFAGACSELLNNKKFIEGFKKIYDCILIDEAQDLPIPFFKLCLKSLDGKERLVYAYDELQKLNEEAMPTPEKLFGKDISHDTPLKVSYRNQSSIIVSAHAFGMGVYKDIESQNDSLIQIPASNDVWDAIGYESSVEIEAGNEVVLVRTPRTSPDFLGVNKEDLIHVYNFSDKNEQYDKLLELIEMELNVEKVPYDEIIIIDMGIYETENNYYYLMNKLLNSEKNIEIHLAGARNPEDFKREDSIVYTHIYRAKGNEAYLVYIINAQESLDPLYQIGRRNSLFTAMTRSKGWVNILGYGEEMKQLEKEFDLVKEKDFSLYFNSYPTEEEKEQIRQTNVDVSYKDMRAVEEVKNILKGLSKDKADRIMGILLDSSEDKKI